ncbi:MAG: type III-A CRISPR-associated RAMP protein Csm5, partial [Culicoidibacterales bacterium]
SDEELYIYPMETVMQHLSDEEQIWKFTQFLEKNSHQNARVENLLDLNQMINKKMVNDAIYEAFATQLKVKFPLEKREIAATLKTMGKPYIPGGTIKGMLRTALTYKYVKDYLVEDRFLLQKMMRLHTKHDVFNWISSNFGEKANVAADCFRFIQIPDVMIEDHLGVVLEKITTQKAVSGNDNAIEVVLPGAVTEPFAIGIDHRGIEAARKGAIKDRGKVIRFNEQLLNMLTEEAMLKALEEYFEAVAELDQYYWEDCQSVQNKFSKLAEKIDELRDENSREQPMVRIGKSTGYLWHTIGALFMDQKYKQFADQHLDRFLSDRRPKFRPNALDEYPKSRKFVEVSKLDGYELLGFAQLERMK